MVFVKCAVNGNVVDCGERAPLHRPLVDVCIDLSPVAEFASLTDLTLCPPLKHKYRHLALVRHLHNLSSRPRSLGRPYLRRDTGVPQCCALGKPYRAGSLPTHPCGAARYRAPGTWPRHRLVDVVSAAGLPGRVRGKMVASGDGPGFWREGNGSCQACRGALRVDGCFVSRSASKLVLWV